MVLLSPIDAAHAFTQIAVGAVMHQSWGAGLVAGETHVFQSSANIVHGLGGTGLDLDGLQAVAVLEQQVGF